MQHNNLLKMLSLNRGIHELNRQTNAIFVGIVFDLYKVPR